MDYAIDSLDPLVLDQLYSLPVFPQFFSDRGHWMRQWTSVWLIAWIGGSLMYFIFASLSYFLIFDRSARKDPKFLVKQELLEMETALKSIPVMSVISSWIFLAEIRGYSKLHDEPIQGIEGAISVVLQVILYLLFTDSLIYWIHRWLHHPLIYTPIHKLHHKWVVTTPFASHAFHPVDGFLQSTPYHIYVFFFPLNKWLYVFLFIFVNFWTISIHDGSGFYAGSIINGADHHTIHHRQFNYNYGQYFTFWDALCGSHKLPTHDKGPNEGEKKKM
jgi:lathosterol oxidase